MPTLFSSSSKPKQCVEYQNVARGFDELDSNVEGNGGVEITLNDPKLTQAHPAGSLLAGAPTTTVSIKGAGSWFRGKNYEGRAACDMGRCFNASRPGCDTAHGHPLKVYWYPAAGSKPSRDSRNPCALVQCGWLHPDFATPVQQATSLHKLPPSAVAVRNPEDACVLALDPGR